MYTAYNRVYPAELATVEARNASPDRSHNETFDALVITGLFGLLAWQALYLSVVHFAFRYLGVVASRRDTWVLAGLWVGGALLAAVVALLVAGPIYLAVRFIAAHHYLPALGLSLLWCGCIAACIRDLRRKSFSWLTGGLAAIWFVTTLWVGMSI